MHLPRSAMISVCTLALLWHVAPHATPRDMARGTKRDRRSGIHKPPAFGKVDEHVVSAVDEWDGGHGGGIGAVHGRRCRSSRSPTRKH